MRLAEESVDTPATAAKTSQLRTYVRPANATKQAAMIVYGKATLDARQATEKTAKAIVMGKGTILLASEVRVVVVPELLVLELEELTHVLVLSGDFPELQLLTQILLSK